jgi:hypothetical protein
MATEPATENQAQPAQPEILELKVVIHLHGDRATIAVHRPNTDPWIRIMEGLDLEGALEQVPHVLAQATVHWLEQPRYPEYQRPAPPPPPTRPAPPVTRARQVPRGAVQRPPAQPQPEVQAPRMF